MKFIQHYSGSSGNLYEVIASNGKKLMIECGVSWAKVLNAFDYKLGLIEGCFMSHEHKDHSKSALEVMKAGIDLYASTGTLKALFIMKRRAFNLEEHDLIRTESFDILTFGVNHDAEQPLGFVVREKSTNEFLLFATDTSHLVQKFPYPFSIIAIEASYDKDVLKRKVESGEINESLAKRLLTSHMEIQETMRYIQNFCCLEKCHELHLLHMSGRNSDHAKARKLFEDRFFIDVRTVNDVSI